MPEMFINGLREALKPPLPGASVQFEMAHVNREKFNPGELNSAGYRQSAVLILICQHPQGYFIPLTERHVYKGAHSGQISLPGGKFEPADETLANTALRECAEEIGLRHGIELLGELTAVHIPVSGFMVQPFVGFLSAPKPEYLINEKEVSQLIELNLSDLIKPELVKQTTVEPVPGYKLKTPYFDVQGKVLWGATAMILNEFKAVLIRSKLL
ncbi:MAG: NUDIX hydrolase [Bacteroidia bacterium]